MLGLDVDKIIKDIEKSIGMDEMLQLLRSIDCNLKELVAVTKKQK